MPPRPISSMILYFPAMRASLETVGGGVTKVFVREAPSEPAGLNGAAQLLQKRESSLFSA
jgi:hypothetical protein